MTRLILFIVSGMLLYSTGAIADIILKDCYSPKFSKSFDKNEYEYHYYKIDEKNKKLDAIKIDIDGDQLVLNNKILAIN